MSFSSAATEVWTPRRMSLSVSRPNQRSTWLIQEDPVGVKWTWNRGWRASQALIAGVLWVASCRRRGGRRVRRVRPCRSRPETSGIPPPGAAVQISVITVPSAMLNAANRLVMPCAGVVVGAPLGHARHHRQHGLGAVQGLDLRLLVDAEHGRVFRRVVVQPDDIDDLLHEQRVGGQLEPVRSGGASGRSRARSGRSSTRDSPDRLAIDARDQCVASGRCRLQRRDDHLLDLIQR